MCHAEVYELADALPWLALVCHDVRWFDVAMDDLVRVRELQRCADRRENALDIGEIEPAAPLDLLAQTRAAQQLQFALASIVTAAHHA